MTRASRVLRPTVIAVAAVVALSGCNTASPGGQGDSTPSEVAESYAAESSATTTVNAPAADSCTLTAEDFRSLSSLLPLDIDAEDPEEGTDARCNYYNRNSADDNFVEINQYSYSGRTIQAGEGHWLADGLVCADGKPFDNDFDLTSPETALSDVQSYIICQTQPVTDPSRGIQLKNRPYKVHQSDVGNGLYCNIPSNCYLATDDIFYYIRTSYSGPVITGTDQQVEEFFAPIVAVAEALSRSGDKP